MEKAILLKTQLAEAAGFAKSKRFGHKRLAVILLDNFIEIQLSSLMRQKFEWNIYLKGNIYSHDKKAKILNHFDELLKASLEEEIITPNEKMLLAFCHKIRNNLYHKGDEEKLLTQVAIIILYDIIKKYQPNWRTSRMFTTFHFDAVDPYKIETENTFISGGNSEGDWKKFLEKYFVIIDKRNKTASRLISDFLITKIRDAKDAYKFIQTEFDIFFPYAKDWTFNDFILQYSFAKIKESQLEKIKEISDPNERKKEIIKLQEEYLKGWRVKKPERLSTLEKSFKELSKLPIEKSIEKFTTYRDETYLFHDTLSNAASDLDGAIQNAIDIARGK